MALTLEQLNAATQDGVVDLLAGVYDCAPWVAEQASCAEALVSLPALKQALADTVNKAPATKQLELIQAYTDLVSQFMLAASCLPAAFGTSSSAPLAEFHTLNQTYSERFGFAFVLAVDGPRDTGLSQAEVIATLQRRLNNPLSFEQAEALRNINRIAQTRLNKLFGVEPTLGNQLWDWCEGLTLHTDPGYAERGELTVTYLTEAHRACAAEIARLMGQECGFDDVKIDAVGNVVGVYHGQDKAAKRLLTGSHYDTVRNGGIF